MPQLLYALLATARSGLKSQRELALENVALRQQLAVLHRNSKRPKLTNADRAFWVALFGLWPDWQNALILLKSETVIGWHRKGFKLYWSRNRGGRPPIDAEIRTLIARPQTARPFRATIGTATTFQCFEERQAVSSRLRSLRRSGDRDRPQGWPPKGHLQIASRSCFR